MSLKRDSKARLRVNTVPMLTKMLLPMRISSHKIICWKVVIWLKFTVFRPASVMAETTRKSESVYVILREGSEEPQKMREDTMHVPIKYV